MHSVEEKQTALKSKVARKTTKTQPDLSDNHPRPEPKKLFQPLRHPVPAIANLSSLNNVNNQNKSVLEKSGVTKSALDNSARYKSITEKSVEKSVMYKSTRVGDKMEKTLGKSVVSATKLDTSRL